MSFTKNSCQERGERTSHRSMFRSGLFGKLNGNRTGRRNERWALFGCCLLGIALVLTSSMDVTGAPGSQSVSEDLRQAVTSGAEFERSRQWSDAIEHYKASLETWPDNKELQYGLRRARFHLRIDSRYSDSSYSQSLLRLSRSDAIELLDDILYKIHNNYVDSLATTYFIAHGTESVYLALNNESFLENHQIYDRDSLQLRQSRRMLFDEYWNKQVDSSRSGKDLVLEVASRLERELGIPQVPIILEYVFGGCNSLDDYSSYLTPDKLSNLYDSIEGDFVGLGIEMKSETGKGVHLVNVLPNSPAESGGLMPGDYITHIDGIDVLDKSTDESADLITGESGSTVRLRWITSEGIEREGSFTRRSVHIDSIPIARMIDEQNGIGYIRQAGFQRKTPAEFDAALTKLRREGMQALVWDLRGNPGGLLTGAVEVLDRLIDEGTLVSTRGRTSDQNLRYSAHGGGTLNIPLVLLIDENSASASEIVAGAIRDHQRGLIVGRKSYGKWSVQSIFPVSHSCGLRLTTAKFYSPDGHNYGGVGLEPDVLVEREGDTPLRIREETLMEDQDVLKAIEALQRNGQLTSK